MARQHLGQRAARIGPFRSAAARIDDGDFDDVIAYFLPFILLVVGANILFAYLRWTKLTYTVGDADIRVESGVLSRAARSVPYERIQDVSLEQKPLPRRLMPVWTGSGLQPG
ncbi:MAG: hypothetical protein COB97_04930, partial [Paracoccus sp.]